MSKSDDKVSRMLTEMNIFKLVDLRTFGQDIYIYTQTAIYSNPERTGDERSKRNITPTIYKNKSIFTSRTGKND